MSFPEVVGDDHGHGLDRDDPRFGTSHHFFDVCGRQNRAGLLESPSLVPLQYARQ